VPHEVENEWPRLWKRSMRELAGKCLCCGAHGLSCAVTAWRGDTSHTLLFDTGPEAAVFEQNVERWALTWAPWKASCCRTAMGSLRRQLPARST
jgi:7,8-dihydropterin-6-yl-methyl-4-(beta-D-ribofuranosyl)aminobenzene 5'-phosphate synthase